MSPNAMALAIQLDIFDVLASLPKLKELAESGSVQERLNYFELMACGSEYVSQDVQPPY